MAPGTEIDDFFPCVHLGKSEADIGIKDYTSYVKSMSDLKQTLTELVKYLDSVHVRNRPTAKPDASSTVCVIRYCVTSQEIGDTRFSADARSVVACKYMGTDSGSIDGKLKQAVVTARRGKRRGGNNAKWAQEFFGTIRRMGGIALREVEAPVKATAPKAEVKVEKEIEEPASEPIDETQWGTVGSAAAWEDDEDRPVLVALEPAGNWEDEDW